MIYLEPETHTYLDEHGRIVPSCSAILSDLVQFGNAKSEDVEHARERGKAGHAATVLFDNNDLDYASLDEEIAPRVEAWDNFLSTTGFEIEVLGGVKQIEVARMHGHFVYACTKDRSGYLPVGKKRKLIMLEIKITAVHSPVTAVQLAAQWEADNRFRKMMGYPLIEDAYSVRLKKDGRFDLKSMRELCGNNSKYTLNYNFACFAACLTRHNWRLNHESFYRKEYYAEAERLERVNVAAA